MHRLDRADHLVAESGDGTEFDGTEFDRLLGPAPPPFALLHRPDATGPDQLEVLVGEVSTMDRLADLPLPPATHPASGCGARHEVLAVLPYSQIRERGFECHDDDDESILAISVARQGQVPVTEALRRIPDDPIALTEAGFDIDDEVYARTVRTIIGAEIGDGAGSNFVIKRAFTAMIPRYSSRVALSLFRRLLVGELGAYWTFLVHTGSRTFVGASPERHVSVADGTVVMNPISGTYRYPPSGPSVPGVLSFLSDRKEAEELYMVVDEELKMMANVCDFGGRVVGPYLKEMAQLAHTEYFLEGQSSLDVREVIRRTMFAPTVTGSPLENACRVLARHEPVGRGYYSGALALIGRDSGGKPALDSSILIRTADIDQSGHLQIGVGATLVRRSDPDSEVAETWAKAAAVLAAVGVDTPASAPTDAAITRQPRPENSDLENSDPENSDSVGEHHDVRSALQLRNARLAHYWLEAQDTRCRADPWLSGLRVLVVDAEDAFTAMLAVQLRSLGLAVQIRRYDQVSETDDFDPFDLVVVGPGPGDPCDEDDRRIAALRRVSRRLIHGNTPFLSVCLGHQVLASLLGLEVVRKEIPNQGVQEEIDLFGRSEPVGFYNTFAAKCDRDLIQGPDVHHPIEVSRDAQTGEVHALRGPGFASTQFHPESLLTQHGIDIVGELLRSAHMQRRTQ